MRMLRLLTALALCLGAAACSARGIGHETARIGGADIEVFTYRPGDCAPQGLLFVFHGMSRNAEDYADHARGFADRACLLVFAPLFDAERFPVWRYHGGGIATLEGEIQPPENWTVPMAGDLIDWGRALEKAPDAPVYLFGHSAGAQFLSRVAAFGDLPDVARIVIANPSTHVMPDLSEPAPFGLGGLPEGQGERLLARYLSRPVTVYLGGEDTGGENLYAAPAAERQGRNRLERGRAAYTAAQTAAARHGLPCNWKLVEAPGVGHDATRMLDAIQAPAAFGLSVDAAAR